MHEEKQYLIHGCFWHGHACPRGARIPKSNRAYWERKISRNRERDAQSQESLKRDGWRVMTIWECEMGDERELKRRLHKFLEYRIS